MKKIIKYILIFFITLGILITLLTVIAKIPRKYVENNLRNATSFFQKHQKEIKYTKLGKRYSYLHPYADQIILNIIYNINTDKPLKSVLEARYYANPKRAFNNTNYIYLVNENPETNFEYIRYWHGSIIIIKLLLLIFTLEQIYVVNAIILAVLSILLIILLVKHKQIPIAISLILGLIMVSIWYVPFTFEYTWMFILMFVISIIAVHIECKKEKKDNKLYILFLIAGMLTCFFDFLTTELISILIPLLIILSMRISFNTFKNFKDEFVFLIKSLILWSIGYFGMWISKWIISSIVLNLNSLDYVINKAMVRVNGKVLNYTQIQLMLAAIKMNFANLLPFNMIKKSWILILIVITVITVTAIIIDRKNKKKMSYMLLMLLVAIIPYIRYMVLANHSFKHSFFTFRSQIITIMCAVLIICYCTDTKKLFKKVEIKRKKEK